MSCALMQQLLQEHGMTRRQATQVTQEWLGLIERSLSENGEFALRGLGAIQVVRAKPRAIKPQGFHNGSLVRETAPVRVRFTTSKMLREKIRAAHAPAPALAARAAVPVSLASASVLPDTSSGTGRT